MEQSTLQRELRPLQAIKDNYKKLILTLDEFTADYEGIEKKNIIDWLIELN